MAGIEFLEPDAIVPVRPDDTPAPGVLERIRPLIPAGLWALAAILAVLAPFQRVFVLKVRAFAYTETQAVDGWGNVSQAHLPYREYETQYGVILWVAAALFALAAGASVLVVRGGRASRPCRRIAAAAGWLGAGAVGGAVWSALLSILAARASVLSALSSSVNDQVVQTGPSQSFARLEFGPMLWLGAATLLLALAAVALGRLARPAKPVDVVNEPYAELRDGDEQIG